MSFILFDVKHHESIEIPERARDDMITRIDHDYPPYVKQIPCIYDVMQRKCHNGLDECATYLQKYAEEPVNDPIENDENPAEHPVSVEHHVSIEHPSPRKPRVHIEPLAEPLAEPEKEDTEPSPKVVEPTLKKKSGRRRKV